MLQIRYTYMWRRKMKVPSRIIEWLIFHRVNSKSSSELEIIEWTHLVPSRIIEWLIFRNTNSYCFFRVRMNFLVKRIQISRFNCNSHPFHKERAKREGANHNKIWKLQKKRVRTSEYIRYSNDLQCNSHVSSWSWHMYCKLLINEERRTNKN